MLRVSDLDYELPPDRIATEPAPQRDGSRLLVVSRSDPNRLEHALVRDLTRYLGHDGSPSNASDLLVVNTSRVIPARLTGYRADTRGSVEGLYLGPADAEASVGVAALSRGAGSSAGSGASSSAMRWRVMLRAGRLREGVEVVLLGPRGEETGVRLRLVARSEREGDTGAWIVEALGLRVDEHAIAALERVGTTPLPPYIRSARKRGSSEHSNATPPGERAAEPPAEPDDARDRERYQTVYAQAPQRSSTSPARETSAAPAGVGSVAAPTAGLHFTPALLDALARRGVERADVTLHVGTGTFKPVECEHVEDHPMHSEWCGVPASTCASIARARASGRRVVAVGTTSARTLESFAPEALARGAESANGASGCEAWTRLLITPGHRWRNLDGLMTNFHLPRSTLMAMVAALLDERSGAARGDGVARLQAIYRAAIDAGYRFYSFGDAMLVLP